MLGAQQWGKPKRLALTCVCKVELRMKPAGEVLTPKAAVSGKKRGVPGLMEDMPSWNSYSPNLSLLL